MPTLLRARLGSSSLLLWSLAARPALAFPGVIVGQDAATRVAHTAHVAIMYSGPISVVTTMVDYRGPSNAFALIMPVERDVSRDRVRAVKREFLARVEQTSAPRFHAFFEQDPCDPEPVEQDWEVSYQVFESGFLAPEFLPPPERHWSVPNDIAIATEPVFKQAESEFNFRLVRFESKSAFDTWLSHNGYHASAEALGALEIASHERPQMLVAEVNVARAELAGNGDIQLGAIRYWTREPVRKLMTRLGLLNSSGVQDLFLYVLHPSQRYQIGNYRNVTMPTNIVVDPAAAERTGTLYNALYDAELGQAPSSFVTEYVWPTNGCGQPCPNAPLTLSELMTLGGDIGEAQLVSSAAQHPDPEPESNEERLAFEQQQLGKTAREKAKAEFGHRADRRELARRRALLARQRYVMSRMHFATIARPCPTTSSCKLPRPISRAALVFQKGPVDCLSMARSRHKSVTTKFVS